MAFTEFILVMFILFYTRYFYQLIFNKEKIRQQNTTLKILRKKSVKTVEEQKEFINIRYPKLIGTFKFSWKWFGKFIIQLGILFIFFRLYLYLLGLLPWTFKLWQVFLIIIIIPLIINLILSKFNLQTKSDISIMFKGWRNKK